MKKAEAKKKDTLVYFTVEIDYFDYLSRAVGADSKGLHRRPAGSQARIGLRDRRSHGECSHFCQSHPTGPLGLFLRNHLAGPANDPQLPRSDCGCQERLHPAVHRTHKEIHLEANPPLEIKVPYDDKVSFRMESEPSDAATALKPGNWVQIHEPRPQMIALWNRDTAYDPAEQQPVEEGKRGLANDLTCRPCWARS